VTSWERELREFFPAYFMPASSVAEMSLEEAERFLSRLGISANSLVSFIDASILARLEKAVRQFVETLSTTVDGMPSRTRVEQAETNGVARGRVDVRRTLQARLCGRPGAVVACIPRRNFDVPENVLLAATARRIADMLTSLEAKKVIPSATGMSGWGAGLVDCANKIARLLDQTKLGEVRLEPIKELHLLAARQSPYLAHHLALELYVELERGRDPAQLSRIVAEGALAPLDSEKRFELAVIIRLVRGLEAKLRDMGFSLTQHLVRKGRREIFEFATDRKQILIHLDQAVFTEWGSREQGMRHYFNGARRRPDVSIEFLVGGQRTHAVVIEAKESSDREYLKEGFHEAILYHVDHGVHLPVWPGSILVASKGELMRQPSAKQPVIAVGWNDWVPPAVLDSLLSGFLAA
jgi:hypothetical protein